MIYITIRTDKPEAEIGLYEDNNQLEYEVWTAHRQLAETIHQKIIALLEKRHITLQNVGGFVCYQGPGSFTGLRIGLSVANAFAYGLQVPIIGVENEENWLEKGLRKIMNGDNQKIITPEYGAPVHITEAKK